MDSEHQAQKHKKKSGMEDHKKGRRNTLEAKKGEVGRTLDEGDRNRANRASAEADMEKEGGQEGASGLKKYRKCKFS